MDDIVKQAMTKWPNVPHCYGWLALDARGAWRMRDERAQALKLPGDKINNSALLAFINRNYTHDERGCWYFQNGPQRVYVNLEVAPFIARTDPAKGFVLHTGEPVSRIDTVWLTENGQLVLKSGDKIALVDDRDMVQCLDKLRLGAAAVKDDQLLEWLQSSGTSGELMFVHVGQDIPVQPIRQEQLAAQCGFIPTPQPQAAAKSASS